MERRGREGGGVNESRGMGADKKRSTGEGRGGGEDVSGKGTNTVLFYVRSHWKHLIKAAGRIWDGKDCNPPPSVSQFFP